MSQTSVDNSALVTNMNADDIVLINLIDKTGDQGLLGRWLFAALEEISTLIVSEKHLKSAISLNTARSTASEEAPGIAAASSSKHLCVRDHRLPSWIDRDVDVRNRRVITIRNYCYNISNVIMLISPLVGWGINEVLFSQIKVKYIWFDFHRYFYGRSGGWNALRSRDGLKPVDALLCDIYEEHMSGNYFHFNATSNSVMKLQRGVIRTNCIDSLDRTNVVQVV